MNEVLLWLLAAFLFHRAEWTAGAICAAAAGLTSRRVECAGRKP